ncbi:MAG TPA: TetR/AcrR family transcriptional regulator [Limnochordia bacterium]|nr:TetR/AcrR family transcriptional regulator [Limnochordia bacterium]
MRIREFNYRALVGEANPLLRYPELKEAAIAEFALKSYEDASLNDILKQAGMSKGSFYHHFGDKFGLYVALMDVIAQKKLSYFYPLMEEGLDSSDFFGVLKQVMRATTEFMLADERLHHLSNRLLAESEELRSRLYSIFGVDYYQPFKAWVHQAVQQGQIDSRYPPEFVAGLVEILLANVHKLVAAAGPEGLLQAALQVVDVIQFGISRPRRTTEEER